MDTDQPYRFGLHTDGAFSARQLISDDALTSPIPRLDSTPSQTASPSPEVTSTKRPSSRPDIDGHDRTKRPRTFPHTPPSTSSSQSVVDAPMSLSIVVDLILKNIATTTSFTSTSENNMSYLRDKVETICHALTQRHDCALRQQQEFAEQRALAQGREYAERAELLHSDVFTQVRHGQDELLKAVRELATQQRDLLAGQAELSDRQEALERTVLARSITNGVARRRITSLPPALSLRDSSASTPPRTRVYTCTTRDNVPYARGGSFQSSPDEDLSDLLDEVGEEQHDDGDHSESRRSPARGMRDMPDPGLDGNSYDHPDMHGDPDMNDDPDTNDPQDMNDHLEPDFNMFDLTEGVNPLDVMPTMVHQPDPPHMIEEDEDMQDDLRELARDSESPLEPQLQTPRLAFPAQHHEDIAASTKVPKRSLPSRATSSRAIDYHSHPLDGRIGIPAAPKRSNAKKTRTFKGRVGFLTKHLRESDGEWKGHGNWPAKKDNTLKGRMQEIVCEVVSSFNPHPRSSTDGVAHLVLIVCHWACAGLDDDEDVSEDAWFCPDCDYALKKERRPRGTIEVAHQDKCIRGNCILREKQKIVRKVGDEEEYSVERIIGRKAIERTPDRLGRIFLYLVKWVGWDIDDATWEPEGHLEHHTKEKYEFIEELGRLGIPTKHRLQMLPEATKWWDDEGLFKGPVDDLVDE